MPLYALGANGMGQLGIGSIEDHNTPQEVYLPPEFLKPPITLVGGGNHLLIIDSYKNVFGCGNNKALKIDKLDTLVYILTQLSLYNNISNISCGFSHNAVIMDSGIHTFGENQFGQLVNNLNDTYNKQIILSQFKYVTCGPRSTLAIKEDGTLWGWGVVRGVFKNGTSSEPYQLIGFPSVKKVLAGFYHILVLTEDGLLYTQGQNRYGQLGVLEYKDDEPSLVIIKEKVVDIQVGWHTCFVLTESGNVWGWGRNDHFQLGTQGTFLTPYQLPLKDIFQIASGSEHSLALNNKGQVFLWGWNEHGNCGSSTEAAGHLSTSDVQTPTLLTLPKQEKATKIGAGYGFSLIWCEGP